MWALIPATAAAADPPATEAVTVQAEALCACKVPWREYTRAPTPEVRQLFQAARQADEATFARLVGHIPDLQEYAVDDQPLLIALLRPVEALTPEVTVDRLPAWQLPPEELARLRAAHAATLPAKNRMLALALRHGAGVNDTSSEWRHPPLHLATVFGTPEMVRLLLQHGADVSLREERDSKTPLEFALDHEFFLRMTGLPPLVDPAERTEMLKDLLTAGAPRPYQRVDDTLKSEGDDLGRPAADYLLWPALAELTQGAEVMDAMARTGTQPAFDADSAGLSVLAHAARAGNLGGMTWLKARAPRLLGDGNTHGQGEQFTDLWLSAAVWALYPRSGSSAALARRDEILNALLVAGMPWGQSHDLRDDSDNALLRRNDLRRPRTGQTLLHHLAAIGHLPGVQRAVQLGAPVDGEARQDGTLGATPLAEAVHTGQLEMVRHLLALGANPLAGDRSNAPLHQALNPQDGERAEGPTPAERQTRRAILAALLERLTPAQKAALADGDASPLRQALQSYAPDAEVVRLLLAAGLPTHGLDAQALVGAMRSDDPTLAAELLARGASVQERPPADGPAEHITPLVLTALRWHRDELLPALLQAGADANQRDDGGRSPVDWAIFQGRQDWLDLLLAHGARIETVPTDPQTATALDHAAASGDEAMLRRVAALWNHRLDQACLANGTLLALTVLETPDPHWALLTQHGFADAAASAAACAGLAPRAERLLRDLLDHPDDIHVGWRATRLAARLRDLWPAVTPPWALPLREEAQATGRNDLVAALQAVGVQAPPPVPHVNARPAARPSARDRALQKKLAGHYYLRGVHEVGSEILLHADGRFEYMLAYGAADELAQGRWEVLGGRVVFSSPPPAPMPAGWVPFRLRDHSPTPTGDEAPSNDVGVQVFFRERPVSDVAVTVVGCEAPNMVRGRTGRDGWSGPLGGPVCQVVLHHTEANEGRAYVHVVAPSAQAAAPRRLAFDLQPPPQPAHLPFNVEMAARQGALVWQREGRALTYVRQ